MSKILTFTLRSHAQTGAFEKVGREQYHALLCLVQVTKKPLRPYIMHYLDEMDYIYCQKRLTSKWGNTR